MESQFTALFRLRTNMKALNGLLRRTVCFFRRFQVIVCVNNQLVIW